MSKEHVQNNNLILLLHVTVFLITVLQTYTLSNTTACTSSTHIVFPSSGNRQTDRQTDRPTDRLHEAEPFMRSQQSLSYSRNSLLFMETEGSLSCSEEPA